jgi:hypothetical protein
MQELAVGIIVLVAVLYVGAKYLPAAWRRRIVHRLSKRAGADSAMVRWLDTSASCGSGCKSCNTCETDENVPAGPQGAGPSAPGKHRVIKLHERR